MNRSARLVALTTVAGALAASAPPARAGEPAADHGDNRGLLVSAALSIGAGGTGSAVGAEGELGWGVTPWLAVLTRASVVAVFDREGFTELQLGVRLWPDPATPFLSFELHGGELSYGEEYDCTYRPPPEGSICWGGEGSGHSFGAALRLQVRGRHASFDVLAGHDRLSWRDASTHARDGANITRLGLGFSFY